jgi:hypothetical protein
VAFADATTRFHPADVTPGTSFTDAGAVLLFVKTTPGTTFSDHTEELQHTQVTGNG